jgi:MFS family permease
MVENAVDNVKKWWVFIGASLMIFLVNIDATIVNLALATIAKDLHSNLTQIQWVINSYLFTGMIFFIIGGKLSDIVGQKIIFLIGTLLFAGSSLIAALAPNFTVLIIGRLIQGIGFAFTLSLAILIISNAFPPRRRGFIVSIAITITGLGQAIGPTLGGAILDELSWHWIFAINVPLAVLSFIIISLFVKPQVLHKKHEKIDIFGAMLFGLFITALLFTFNALTHQHVDIGLFL